MGNIRISYPEGLEGGEPIQFVANGGDTHHSFRMESVTIDPDEQTASLSYELYSANWRGDYMSGETVEGSVSEDFILSSDGVAVFDFEAGSVSSMVAGIAQREVDAAAQEIESINSGVSAESLNRRKRLGFGAAGILMPSGAVLSFVENKDIAVLGSSTVIGGGSFLSGWCRIPPGKNQPPDQAWAYDKNAGYVPRGTGAGCKWSTFRQCS